VYKKTIKESYTDLGVQETIKESYTDTYISIAIILSEAFYMHGGSTKYSERLPRAIVRAIVSKLGFLV
jgi:hypothetical protein